MPKGLERGYFFGKTNLGGDARSERALRLSTILL